MTRFGRLVIPLCLVLHFSSLLLLAGEPQWVEVRSDHFTVITDDGEKSGRHVAELFERMRAAFGVIFMRTKVNQTVPLQIIAFRNTKEVRQNSPIFQGKVVELAGFFQTADDKDFIVLDLSQEDNWQTVFHEYAHLLLDGNFPPTAPWFDEGFAEYLSTMKISKDGTIEIGSILPGAELLNEASTFHLLDLFRVQHFSETYNRNGVHRDMFYVESWLVAHYVFDTNQLGQTARYFLFLNEKKMSIPDAVQAAYGMPLAQMEKTIRSNWRSGKLYAKRFNQKLPTTTFNATVRTLDPLEARSQLADLHVHMQDYTSKGIQEYEEVLRQNPNQGEAQRGIGYAYLRQRDLAKASEHYRAAAKLGSSDPRVYFYSAVLLQQTDPSAVGSAEFMGNLQRAIQLDPRYAEAYGLLAFGYMRNHKLGEAEQNLRRAIELSPRNEMNRFNLAVVLANQQKLDEAKVVLSGLTKSSSPNVAQQANQMMAEMSRIERPRSTSPSPDAPAVLPVVDEASLERRDVSPSPSAAPDKRPIAFLSGKIVSVDCSAAPGAVLTMSSSGKTYHLRVEDREKLVLINVSKFSCDWKDAKASANYRDGGNMQGDLVSLELP